MFDLNNPNMNGYNMAQNIAVPNGAVPNGAVPNGAVPNSAVQNSACPSNQYTSGFGGQQLFSNPSEQEKIEERLSSLHLDRLQASAVMQNCNINSCSSVYQNLADIEFRSQNMTECVEVPSSEHVAEIVGRQGCKIKSLRAKTNTYIKTPVRGESPIFVVTGRKEDVQSAKSEILSAAHHFTTIRASRKNNFNGSTAPGPPDVQGQTTIQVWVPYKVVGLVVGPKGATIKRIQQTTHTYIVTPSREKPPIFEVTGLPDNVNQARKEIESHIVMRTGSFCDEDVAMNLFCTQNNISKEELLGNSNLLNFFRTQYMQTLQMQNAQNENTGYDSNSALGSLNSTAGHSVNNGLSDLLTASSSNLLNSMNRQPQQQQHSRSMNTGLNGASYLNLAPGSYADSSHTDDRDMGSLFKGWNNRETTVGTSVHSNFSHNFDFSSRDYQPNLAAGTIGEMPDSSMSAVPSVANFSSLNLPSSLTSSLGINTSETSAAFRNLFAKSDVMETGSFMPHHAPFNLLGDAGASILEGGTNSSALIASLKLPENKDEGIDSLGSSNANSKATSPSLEDKKNALGASSIDKHVLSAKLTEMQGSKALSSRGTSPVEDMSRIWAFSNGPDFSKFNFETMSAIDGMMPIHQINDPADLAMEKTAGSVAGTVLSGDDDSPNVTTTNSSSRRSSTDQELLDSAAPSIQLQLPITVSDN